MVELPWQIVAALVAIVIVNQLISYLKSQDSKELIRSERNDERRTTMATFRDTYRHAWKQGLRDVRANHDDEIRRVVREIRDEKNDRDS